MGDTERETQLGARAAHLSVPVLQTDRLILRGHSVADFPGMVAMWAHPNVTRFIGGKPNTPEETWAKLLKYGGLWPLLGSGYWAVEHRATGKYVGDVGFGDFHRAIEPEIRGIPELGWALTADFHGQGLGTEAVRAALEWSDRVFPGEPTVAIVSPDNPPSMRVAEKAGYAEKLRTSFKDTPAILYERLP